METPPIRILLIEDDPDDSAMLRADLDASGVRSEIVQITRLGDARPVLETNVFDLILLDLMLPDSRGLESLAQLLELVPDAPIVVLSVVNHEPLALQAVKAGAQDYLVKGSLQAQDLQRALLFALERHRRQAHLEKLSLQDPLTNLYNRRGFMSQGTSVIRQAHQERHELILFLADVDRLKWINDTYGHSAGDHALLDVAALLQKTFRKSEIIARLGGDEFAILVTAAAEVGPTLLDRLEMNLQEHNAQPGRAFPLSLSVGYSLYAPVPHISLEALLESADLGLYAEKQRRRQME